MKKYLLGIDLGGTKIKGGIIDATGIVYAKESIPTEAHLGSEKVLANVTKLCLMLTDKAGITLQEIEKLGVGIPGIVNNTTGIVEYNNNLHWNKVNVRRTLEKNLGLPVSITNDANAAALGEACFGAGKEYKNSILVTLGTGVGGGIIIDNKVFEGNQGAGAEIGHMVIAANAVAPCTCGRNGCFEYFSSATGLIRQTKQEMIMYTNSKLWDAVNGDINLVDGTLAFKYEKEDLAAKHVVNRYLFYLACGVSNLINIFRPEVIMLGGGVANQGENLTAPLQKLVDEQIYGGDHGPKVLITTTTLKNDAGFMGAAML